MVKYTIVDIDLNVDIDKILQDGALQITEKANKMLVELIQDTKSLEDAVETKKKIASHDEPNKLLYELFWNNENRVSKTEMQKMVPDKFKSFSTMVMRFGNFLRKKGDFEFLRKETKSDETYYILETIPDKDDSVKP
jgi:hypothetical protein